MRLVFFLFFIGFDSFMLQASTKIESDGTVTIRSHSPPKSTVQYASAPYRTTGPIKLLNGMPYRDVATGDNGNVRRDIEQESIVTSDPFTIVQDAGDIPYSSCGQLEMLYADGMKRTRVFYGSASAVKSHILITAAHNLMPPTDPNFSDKRPNKSKIRATSVKFLHRLLEDNSPCGTYDANVKTHCYVHPEWDKSFNPKYDIAFIFLDSRIDAGSEGFLSMFIGATPSRVKVVGYLAAYPVMRSTEGDTSESFSEPDKVIYHNANTLGGSSGSPILKDASRISGIHTTSNETDHSGFNTGVRIRKDVVNFFDKCEISDSNRRNMSHKKSRWSLNSTNLKCFTNYNPYVFMTFLIVGGTIAKNYLWSILPTIFSTP